jgi:hypothetical protein
MEFDTDDEMKQELLRKSAHHREELEGDVRLITESTQKILTNALVIGGSLALTYILVRQFTKPAKRKRKVKAAKIRVVNDTPRADVEETVVEGSSPGMISQIGTAVAAQASAFLLNLAKEKLTEFLQAQAEKKSPS